MGTEQNSYNKMGMFTFISSMVVSLGVLIYVAFLSGGIDLKEVPNTVKTEQKAPADTTAAPQDPAVASPAASPVPAASPAPAASPTKDGLGNGTVIDSDSYLALNDRWSLVHFTRAITKNKILDSDADGAAQAATLN